MLNLQNSKTENLIEIILEKFPGSYVLDEKEVEPFRFLKSTQPRQQKGSYTRERLGSERASAGKSVRKGKTKGYNKGQLSLFSEKSGGCE